MLRELCGYQPKFSRNLLKLSFTSCAPFAKLPFNKSYEPCFVKVTLFQGS
eukprot:m.14063 g.14063  ORF g.14063 m.14063 type:complete len:50 (-) comp8744_c0_seq1:58-207(-)